MRVARPRCLLLLGFVLLPGCFPKSGDVFATSKFIELMLNGLGIPPEAAAPLLNDFDKVGFSRIEVLTEPPTTDSEPVKGQAADQVLEFTGEEAGGFSFVLLRREL